MTIQDLAYILVDIGHKVELGETEVRLKTKLNPREQAQLAWEIHDCYDRSWSQQFITTDAQGIITFRRRQQYATN